MRIISTALFNQARTPQRPQQTPFQEILPLRLKNRVSGKSDSQNETACIQELTLLINCMKENEFQESLCGPVVEKLNKCYKQHLDALTQAKAIEKQATMKTGNKLNYKHMNKYLRRYPNL